MWKARQNSQSVYSILCVGCLLYERRDGLTKNSGLWKNLCRIILSIGLTLAPLAKVAVGVLYSLCWMLTL